MSKISLKEIKQKRDGGGGAVLIMPHVVLNSAAYISLSPRAVKLLYDIAMQYNTYNNGALLASWRYMREKRGWASSDALSKAKSELLECQLISQTVQGMRPNKASWFGLTWLALDNISGMEVLVKDWPRGAYAHWVPSTVTSPKRIPPPRETREAYYKGKKNAVVRTPDK